MTPDDLAFIEKFEQCGFSRACWNHEAHLRMAWIQLSRAGSYDEGLKRIRDGILRFNSFVGANGYHETVTVAFTRLVQARRQTLRRSHSWAEFLHANGDLLARQPGVLSRFYTEGELGSSESKEKFIEPGVRPLPPVGHIRLARDEDAEALLAIYSPHITDNSTSFEIEVPTVVEFRDRMRDYSAHAPWLVYEVGGNPVGYAYASKHRERAAYRWSVETSVYLAADYRRGGLARLLYLRLFEELKHAGFCLALAGVTFPNEASVRFHESLGFQPIGVYPNIGFKFGKWHDVGWWQKPIQPAGPHPREPRWTGIL